MKMKILAINSSPSITGQSKTELLLSHLVEGLRATGAEVEVVNLRQKKINYCFGCYTCWTKTPGYACTEMIWLWNYCQNGRNLTSQSMPRRFILLLSTLR
jgi:hypothetical protein